VRRRLFRSSSSCSSTAPETTRFRAPLLDAAAMGAMLLYIITTTGAVQLPDDERGHSQGMADWMTAQGLDRSPSCCRQRCCCWSPAT